MREFRRLSFTDAEVMHALAMFAPDLQSDREKAGRRVIRSKRIKKDFFFELADAEDDNEKPSALMVPVDLACLSLIEHSIQSHIPIPKNARKDVRLIHDHICLDMFIDVAEAYEYSEPVDAVKEFRRIIFSNKELKEALSPNASKYKRPLARYTIIRVEPQEAVKPQDPGMKGFELELFDYLKGKSDHLHIPHGDVLTALLDFTHEHGVRLPRRATKKAIESEGLVNLELGI